MGDTVGLDEALGAYGLVGNNTCDRANIIRAPRYSRQARRQLSPMAARKMPT